MSANLHLWAYRPRYTCISCGLIEFLTLKVKFKGYPPRDFVAKSGVFITLLFAWGDDNVVKWTTMSPCDT